MKKMLCLLLSAVMVLGMLAGCGNNQSAQPDATETAQHSVTQEIPDEEIQKAIDLGFVPEALQGDYDSQISYTEFCSILDGFISLMFPDALSEWKNDSQKYRDSTTRISRMEGALVFLYAAECCGVDTVGYEYNIPLEDLIAEDVNFYEGVSWTYPLLPDIYRRYYNETLANSEHYSWRDGMDYAGTAKLFVEYMSYGNGKTYFDYDERYSLNLGKAFTRGDAIRAVERLYENARFAKYVPAVEVSCTVSDATRTLAERMPEASCQKLPEWHGHTVPPGNWRAGNGASMLYEKEFIEVLGDLGFDFVRAPLDSRMIFNGSDMTAVNPAYLETMDDLIEYCAEEGIHVCFDLHDMPGFYTGGDDSQITLWDDPETQEIFVEFWRFMAEYYKDIPTNLLSFNLLNEPHGADDLTDAHYSEIMLMAIDAIREVTPDRLIFADTLGVLQGTPVQGLADAQVVQTVHPYFLRDGTQTWPCYTINNFMHRGNGELTINGNFSAGSTIAVTITAVHSNSTFLLTADGIHIGSLDLGKEAVGENGCTGIAEEGTGGECRFYEGIPFTITLTEDAKQIKLQQENGWWYMLSEFRVETDRYAVSIMASDSVISDETVPILSVDENGAVSAKKEGTLVFQGRAWLEELFESYQGFTEETGTLIMVQEFGFNNTIDYQATLAAADDFLAVLDAYDIPWCCWCSDFGPLLDKRECEWGELMPWGMPMKRVAAEYQMVSENYMIDTGLMEVFQTHMKN